MSIELDYAQRREFKFGTRARAFVVWQQLSASDIRSVTSHERELEMNHFACINKKIRGNRFEIAGESNITVVESKPSLFTFHWR